MTAHILDGRALAAGLRARVAAEVSRLAAEHGLVPGLAMIKVGADPASAV
jgi:methylenetetrahydrofolate dehydrogenase (NADP+) / methenyltetrahydrofolate cyclohydrolase